jgi:ribonuclease-3 family protein
LNGLALAFLGDAYYELFVRKYLISEGITKIHELHQQKVKYTSSVAQTKIITYFLSENILNAEEITYFKKGRNSAHFGRKNVDVLTYQMATGFESLIGYLMHNDTKRCEYLMQLGIEFIKLGEKDGKRTTK